MRKFKLLVAMLALLVGASAQAGTVTFKAPAGGSGGAIDCGGGNSATINADNTYTCTLPATNMPYLLQQGFAVVGAPYAVGNVTGSTQLDMQNGCVQSMTLIGATTLLFPLNVGYCKGGFFRLIYTQNTTGTYNVTYSGSAWKFANSSPVLLTGSGALDQIDFIDDGTYLRYPAAGANPSFNNVVASSFNGAALLHAFVRITASLCGTTGASVGQLCAEPTIAGLPFTDTNYSLACTCIGPPTGVPVVERVDKTAASSGLASQAVVFIAQLTAVSAGCSEVDCEFWE